MKCTNITTKLNWKLFTKVIKTNKEIWVLIDRGPNEEKSAETSLKTESLIKRVKRQALKIGESRECFVRSEYLYLNLNLLLYHDILISQMISAQWRMLTRRAGRGSESSSTCKA